MGGRVTAAQLAALKQALKVAEETLKDEGLVAGRLQASLDEELVEAIEAVVKDGKGTSSNAIGIWFDKVEERVIEDKQLVREKTAKARLANVIIVQL